MERKRARTRRAAHHVHSDIGGLEVVAAELDLVDAREVGRAAGLRHHVQHPVVTMRRRVVGRIRLLHDGRIVAPQRGTAAIGVDLEEHHRLPKRTRRLAAVFAGVGHAQDVTDLVAEHLLECGEVLQRVLRVLHHQVATHDREEFIAIYVAAHAAVGKRPGDGK